MAPRQSKKVTETPVVTEQPAAATVVEAVPEQPVATKAKRTRKPKQVETSAESEPSTPLPECTVEETSVETSVETPVENTVEETPSSERKSRKITVERLNEEIASVLTSLEAEIEKVNLSENKNGAKFLKTLVKKMTDVQKHSLKLLGKKRGAKSVTPGVKPANSGLQRPVSVTPAMAKFMKIPADQKVSRIDGFKAISAYIKEKNLKRPDNGRFISPDKRLSTLLNYIPDPTNPYSLQHCQIMKLMQPLFIKDVKPVA